MFEVHCPQHRSDVLLSLSRIDALHNTPDGIVVDWRCWCGHRGRTSKGGYIIPKGSGDLSLPEAS